MILQNEYFNWLYQRVMEDDGRYQGNSWRRVFAKMHETEFYYSIPRDSNRAKDGIDLRYRFAYELNMDRSDIQCILEGPCSVLEMMIALAIRMEEGIFNDPGLGNRTHIWFWMMMTNMKLTVIPDTKYDRMYAETVLNRMLSRTYHPNGAGGLFMVKRPRADLRETEIWYQMCWAMNEITSE